jgi:hypothetical protein
LVEDKIQFEQTPEQDNVAPVAGIELVTANEASHSSLQLTPPPLDPDRARSRAVVYGHLSGEAITAGAGVARVEYVGPVLLGRLPSLRDRCSISLKPVIDLPAGHTRIDSYEVPARLPNRCYSATPQTCSPAPPSSAVPPISITPFPTSAMTAADRPAKPGLVTSDPRSAAITA